MNANPLGVGLAAMSVASSAMQQILCRYYQKKHALSSNELLGATAPIQGFSLLIIGPLIDRLVVGRWISSYEVNVPALVFLGFSCSIAVLVNISQFMCLGRFSAVTFQVCCVSFLKCQEHSRNVHLWSVTSFFYWPSFSWYFWSRGSQTHTYKCHRGIC